MSHSFQTRLQDDAESSDTFISKAVLTLASYTRTVCYKYNKIPVFSIYHLPSWKQIQKWVHFNILFAYCYVMQAVVSVSCLGDKCLSHAK